MLTANECLQILSSIRFRSAFTSHSSFSSDLKCLYHLREKRYLRVRSTFTCIDLCRDNYMPFKLLSSSTISYIIPTIRTHTAFSTNTHIYPNQFPENTAKVDATARTSSSLTRIILATFFPRRLQLLPTPAIIL